MKITVNTGYCGFRDIRLNMPYLEVTVLIHQNVAWFLFGSIQDVRNESCNSGGGTAGKSTLYQVAMDNTGRVKVFETTLQSWKEADI